MRSMVAGACLTGVSGTTPRSRVALNPALQLASRWCADQGLMARPLSLDEIWAGLPAAVA